MERRGPRPQLLKTLLIVAPLLLAALLLVALGKLSRESLPAVAALPPPQGGGGEEVAELRAGSITGRSAKEISVPADVEASSDAVDETPGPADDEAPSAAVDGATVASEGGTEWSASLRIELRGHVIDARTGVGIAGAQVFLNAPISMTSDARFAVTDEQGCFSLGEAGLLEFGTIVIRARGYALGQWFNHVYAEDFHLPPLEAVERDEYGVRFPLHAGARLFGIVVDESGNPVQGGYVMAYEFGMVGGHLMLDTHDRISVAIFLHKGAPGYIVPNQASWYLLDVPFAAIGEQGEFDLASLPANQKMALVVFANDVKREVVDSVVLGEGEEEERSLVVKRAFSVPGVLVPPEGRSASEFGLWACPDLEAKGVLGDHLMPENHHWIWIPVQEDGSFVVGPLPPDGKALLRVSYRAPSAGLHAILFSSVTLSLVPAEVAGRHLEVDLRRADHFRLLD